MELFLESTPTPVEVTLWALLGRQVPHLPDADGGARMAEVKLAEALAVLDVLKAPRPGSLTNGEKFLASEVARAHSGRVALADVTATLSIPKSTHLDPEPGSPAPARRPPQVPREGLVRGELRRLRLGERLGRPQARTGRARPVARARGGDLDMPIVVSEKVVRREGGAQDHGRGGARGQEGAADEEEGTLQQLRRRAGRGARQPAAPGGRHARLLGRGAGLPRGGQRRRVPLGDYRAYLSPAIDCFDGRPICWRTSEHPDKRLMVDRDPGRVSGPTQQACVRGLGLE